jgi:hypothetical protein
MDRSPRDRDSVVQLLYLIADEQLAFVKFNTAVSVGRR